jgi:hydroxyacylglutathione hydrolase
MQRIEPGLRLVRAANASPMTEAGTNTWIVGEGAVAVIDPGPADPGHLSAILAAVRGERVAAIVVTHAHLDHSALAPELAAATGAPVAAFGPAQAGRSPLMVRLAEDGLAGGEGVDAAFVPDVRLSEGQTVSGPDWALSAIHTPGHFAGHLCLAWGDRLFTGDHVMGWAPSLVSPPDGDMGAYLAALERLSQRRWSRFFPGHGAPVDDPAARLAALTAHRRGREAQVLAALAPGPLHLPALVAAVYADTPAALHPAAARNALAHLIDLWERGEVTADPAPSPTARFALARSP